MGYVDYDSFRYEQMAMDELRFLDRYDVASVGSSSNVPPGFVALPMSAGHVRQDSPPPSRPLPLKPKRSHRRR